MMLPGQLVHQVNPKRKRDGVLATCSSPECENWYGYAKNEKKLAKEQWAHFMWHWWKLSQGGVK